MLRPRKAVLLFLAFASTGGALASEFKPGEVIVKYKEGRLRKRSEINGLYKSIGVKSVFRYSSYYSSMMSGFEHLFLESNTTVEGAITRLEKSGYVAYAQPNYILHSYPVRKQDVVGIEPSEPEAGPCWISGIPFPPGCFDSGSIQRNRPVVKSPPSDVIPSVSDPDIARDYGLSKIGAVEAWQSFRGGKNFVVADIDTGIDYNHEDLAFNIWHSPNSGGQGDSVGFDFVHNDNLPFDDNSHGTHTAGTIGAVGGNGIGVSGVSQRVSLMAVKFLSDSGSGTTSDAIRGIDFAVSNGAKVLSNSWGGTGDHENKALFDAIERAREKDVLFVAAAGNDGSDNDGSSPSYPAAFTNDNLIVVAATDEDDHLTDFSNYGKKTTHLAAPGLNIFSTVPGNKYKSLSGTSMACPHVAGAAALLWSKHPDWTYRKVKDVLIGSVDPVAELADKTVSGGRLNVLRALSVTD